MCTCKLQKAKDFLGKNWCLHPLYVGHKPIEGYQSRVLKPVIDAARKAGRI